MSEEVIYHDVYRDGVLVKRTPLVMEEVAEMVPSPPSVQELTDQAQALLEQAQELLAQAESLGNSQTEA